jgi:N-methylhydantoinase A
MSDTRVGVDVGGTFTDVVVAADGEVRVHKVPSTPDAPDRGVADGLDAARAAGLSPAAVSFFGHGTTVATNAVLEREWADTALVTTAGFRDALEIGRQDRPAIYDLAAEKPRPVVERDARYEVPERLDERGEALVPLDEGSVRGVAAEIDADSVAVSLLFSFENPAHEERVRELLAAELDDDVPVSLSSSVLPEIREYERTLATCLNAGLRPVMDRYVGRLSDRIGALGVAAPLRVMASNGGGVAASEARERPVNTLLSGPAAGVRGATFVAGRAGHEDVVTMDMGGTSCDVSLVEGGEPLVTTDAEVGDYPVSVPTVDVHTVGAGGGSIASLDEGGALRVGPRSAGARPGPACYGRGGTDPTVTDAQAVLGRIDPGAFLEEPDAGVAPARAALEPLADDLGRSVRETAAGVLEVANADMGRALRVVSVERGYDPRRFALVAFGGAGPLHAPALAAALDVPEVLVPRAAGVLSALGLLVADVAVEESASRVRPVDALDPAELTALYDDLAARGRERVADRSEATDGTSGDAASRAADRREATDGTSGDAASRAADGDGSEAGATGAVDGGGIVVERFADLRYAGQSFDLRVPVPDDLDRASLDRLVDRFHGRHEERYGYAAPGEAVEFVTARVRARRVVEPPDVTPDDPDGTVADAVREERTVRFDRDRETPVYDRSRLPAGATLSGPAVIEGGQTTAVLRPGDAATVDADGTLRVEVDG